MRDIDLVIPSEKHEDPFENCLFDRKRYSDILQNLINNYSDGFVLSINNSWGTGKTTFIKMFDQDIKNNDFETIYFNAWENDFETDPLVSIIGELKSLKSGLDTNFEKVVANGAKLLLTTSTSFLKYRASKIFGEDVLNIFENLIEKSQEIAEDEINNFSERKKTINEFKKSLHNYITSRETNKPIVFIIDELDRCKSDYAVNFLENIKHFFSLSGFVFILSIDKIQLSGAIKGYYGSESIDTDEYLKKIIDIELSLPYPDLGVYFKQKMKSFQIKNIDSFYPNLSEGELRQEFEIFLKLCFLNESIPIRKLNKIFNHLFLVINSFNEYDYFNVRPLMFLIYLKYQRNNLYSKLVINELDKEQLLVILIKFTLMLIKHPGRIYSKNFLFSVLSFFNLKISDISEIALIQMLDSYDLKKEIIIMQFDEYFLEYSKENLLEDYIKKIDFLSI